MAVKTISGSSIVLSVDLSGGGSASAVAASTSGTLSVSNETIDVTNKDSSGRKKFIDGVSSWTMDCEVYILSDGTANVSHDFYTALDDGTEIDVEFSDGSGQSDSQKYTGKGYITSWSETAGVGEWATASVSIQGTGQLTKAGV
mgnify:CR=1 FL=1|tara:strand:+ start:12370 stop:12801 length:432 start_codon:yes stop_codon:yes gene_type:complete